MIEKIMKTIKDMLDNIPDLNTFNYYDNSIDISATLTYNPKTDIAAGATTATFVDDWGYDVLEGLVGRYAKFNNEYQRIIAQDEVTGEVTFEAGFSNDITTADDIDIVILDSCYIDFLSPMSMPSRRSALVKRIRVNLFLQTKQDYDNSKINKILDVVGSLKEMYPYIKTNEGYTIRIVGEILSNKIIDEDLNLKKYVTSFLIEYRAKIKNI